MRATPLLCLLAVLLSGCSTKYVYDAPSQPVESATQLRMRPTDSKTLTHHLEQEKRYDELRRLLHRELNQIEIVGRELALGTLPNALERKRIEAAAASRGDAAWQAFRRDNLIVGSPERYDPEGELFVLDDLADLYTYRLVDFTRAEHYNQRAREALERVQKIPLDALPLSPWFNDRRRLYYTLFISPNEGLEKAGFEPVAGHPGYWTLFSAEHLAEVRRGDIERVAIRIQKRSEFIAARLGERALERSGDTSVKSPPNLAPLLAQFADFLHTQSDLTTFEQAFLKAAQAHGGWQSTHDETLRGTLITTVENALATPPAGKSLSERHALNLLHYWLANAQLDAGNLRAGLAAHERFMQGIDTLESLHEARYAQRKTLVDTINREVQEQAEGNRNKALLMVAIALAGGAYSAHQAHQQGLSYNPYQQTFEDMTRMTGQILFSTHDDLQAVRSRVEASEAVVRYISPYALKLNRYLDKYQMTDYLLALGAAYEAQGKATQAVEQYAEAARIIERQRSTIASETGRISFFAARQRLYSRMVPLLIRLNRPSEALEFAERARSRAFVDMLGGTRLELADADSRDQYRASLARLAEVDILLSESGISASQLTQLADRAARGAYVAPRTSFKNRLVTPARQSQLRALAQVETRSTADIRGELPSDSALVEYYLGDGRLSIMFVTPDQVKASVVPLDSQWLTDTLLDWRDAILATDDDADIANELYAKLIAPLEPLGLDPARHKRLLIIPHGPLHYLPFPALQHGHERLLERYAISYAPSATALALTRANQAAEGGALLVGNPTGDLRFAENEAQEIGQIVKQPHLLLGEQGREAELKHHAQGYGLIHLATHGEYNPINPLASRIRLAPGGGEDGSLTTSELFALRWNASLVNLSACQTGLTRNLTGDELIGLQRGIFFAGARSLIASLWSVDDRATGELMTRFYREHEAGQPKDIALQRAQLATRERYPEPYFWAAFGLSGATD